MYKPRFNRSTPNPVKVKDAGVKFTGNNSPTQATEWKPVTIKTLGYLASQGKVSIMQVVQRIGDKPNKEFAKAFLNEIDLYNPTEQDMRQIQLFGHLLLWK
jgi:hypothetical protein